MMKARKKQIVSIGHLEGNRKVAKSRGKTWRAALVAGKAAVKFNPSTLMTLRLKKGVSQAAIAQAVNVSPASYGSIERAKRLVSETRALLIAKKLGVPVKSVFVSKNKGKLLALISGAEL